MDAGSKLKDLRQRRLATEMHHTVFQCANGCDTHIYTGKARLKLTNAAVSVFAYYRLQVTQQEAITFCLSS